MNQQLDFNLGMSALRVAIASIVLALPGAASAERGPWTSRTSVEARYILDSNSASIIGYPSRPILASPDGTRFLFISRRGDMAKDDNIYEMRIYDTRAVEAAARRGGRSPRPISSLIRRAEAMPAITEPQWSDDGRYVLFRGIEEGSAHRNVRNMDDYVFDIASGSVTLLMPDTPRDYNRFFQDGHLIDWRGDRALYVRNLDEPPPPLDPRTPQVFTDYPAQVLSAREAWSFSGFEPPPYYDGSDRRMGLFLSVGGRQVKIAETARGRRYGTGADSPLVRGSIRSSGDIAVIAIEKTDADSKTWREYERVSSSRDGARIGRFMLIDMNTGNMRPLFDAPTGIATKMGARSRLAPDAIWSPDGLKVALVNTALPIEADTDRRTSYLALYDPQQRSHQRIAAMEQNGNILTDVRWSQDGTKLVTEWTPAGAKDDQASIFLAYARDRDRWSVIEGWRPENEEQLNLISWQMPPNEAQEQQVANARSVSWWDYQPARPAKSSIGLSLTLEESADEPQRLIARAGSGSTILLDTRRDFADVRIATSQDIEWRTADGNFHRARLTLPPQPTAVPPPLVIQIYRYMPNIFRPDGYSTSGYAKQALAARGMAVLEMTPNDRSNEPSDDRSETSSDAGIADMIANVEGVLDVLRQRRLVDTERMGAVGFSDGGFRARQLLLSAGRYRLSAAAAHDSHTGSLHEYHMRTLGRHAMGLALSDDAVPALHGGLIHQTPERWLREAIDLAPHRVTGALLEVKNGVPQPHEQVDQLHAVVVPLMSAQRPVELLVFPRGGHNLQRPHERFESMAATVDWMDFWLQGGEDPDPAKREKYKRWRKMKSDWQRQQAWEAAGNPAGSKPDKSFAAPSSRNYGDRCNNPQTQRLIAC